MSNNLAYDTLKTLSHPDQTQSDFFHKDDVYAPETFNKIFGHVLPESEVQ
ncbi:6234_t:CDS:1, partial [Paraglomus occultum]